MRILLIGYMYGQGGIQTHSHFLAAGLVERGHDVTVVTPPPMAGDNRALRHQPGYPLFAYDGIGSALNGLGAGRGQKYDAAVVCGTGWKAMAGILLLPRARKRVFFEVMSGKRSGRLDPRSLVHAGFDAIVGQARAVEDRFCAEFGWTKLHTTIPALPEPLERFCAIPPRAPLPLAPDRGLKLVYFGRLVGYKGIGFLVDHWDRLSEVAGSFDVFGTGPQESELRRKIEQRGLSDVIRLRGAYPSGKDYVGLLQQYDLKLLPTVGAEGAPLVLLEAMACGLPFVANGVGGIPDYANQDCAITNGDIDAFLPLLRNFAARLKAGEISGGRLQSHYLTNFSFAALMDRWESFLQDLTGDALVCNRA